MAGVGGTSVEAEDEFAKKINFLEYEETLLYGRHSRHGLGKFALQEASKFRQKRRCRAVHRKDTLFKKYQRIVFDKWNRVSQTTLGRSFEDWMFLTILGVVVAIFSFVIDLVINRCHIGRSWMLEMLKFSVALQFIGWVAFYVAFVCVAVGLTHIIAPAAIGSGIPEMKTMIRGVVMPEYLTIQTLIAKVVGLTASLGSGLPVGKEGPFVHIAGISAAIIAKFLPSFRSDFENQEVRMASILAPACAVGVACTFAAPVGGLLFSIEATATYFAVRNYWRGFYAASIGTIAFRLLSIWFHEEETLTALERTFLPQDVPFHPNEMLMFALLGILSGFGGIVFITINKRTVLFIRHQMKVKNFLQKNRFIYPSLVALLVGGFLFPPGVGQFMAGELTNPEALKELFNNLTWSKQSPVTYEDVHLLERWSGPLHSVILTTGLFFVMRLWMSAISTTCPFPSGMIVPAFTLGAAFGRLYGETLGILFPNGISGAQIVPGGYALVGSAAFAGAVTHTYSTIVIVFELTGQIGHVLPCVIAVVISNLVSRSLTPSVYDVIIQIKHLPYLPPSITSETVNAHQVFAEDFMVSDLHCLTLESIYLEAEQILDNFSFKAIPLVNNREEMIFLGSVYRHELSQLLEDQFTSDNKLFYMAKRLHHRSSQVSHAFSNSLPDSEADDHESRFPTSASAKDLETEAKSQEHLPTRVSFTSASEVGKLDHEQKLEKPKSKKKFLVKQSSIAEIPSYSSSLSDKSFEHSLSLKEPKQKSDIFPVPKKLFGVQEKVHFQDSVTVELHDPDKEAEWEEYQLQQPVNYSDCHVDPAPFQISPRTSLYRIHSLFSLLSLHHTFVTHHGRLVGVISLTEVRNAIQGEINPKVPSRNSSNIDQAAIELSHKNKAVRSPHETV